MASKNGVYEGKVEKAVTELKETVGLHSSILRASAFVLSESAAKHIGKIIVKCNSGDFYFSAVNTPMPTTKHAFYFDVFCAMFASNWNQEGKLFYRFSDVLKITSKNPRAVNAIECIVECIRRYMGSHVQWKHSFQMSKDGDEDWSGSFIEASSVFDEQGNVNIKHVGNSKKKEDWHFIQFHRKIVEALNPYKDPRTRLFISEIFKMKLTQGEIAVYRYFYGHFDSKMCWKSLYKEKEGLIHIFKWTSHRSQFLPWLEKAIKGLIEKRLVEIYELNADKSAIGVKCFHKDQINSADKNVIVLEKSHEDDSYRWQVTPDGDMKKLSRRKGATAKPRKISANNITDEALLEEYFSRKSKGLMDKTAVEAIDILIAKGLKDIYLGILRTHLADAQR